MCHGAAAFKPCLSVEDTAVTHKVSSGSWQTYRFWKKSQSENTMILKVNHKKTSAKTTDTRRFNNMLLNKDGLTRKSKKK